VGLIARTKRKKIKKNFKKSIDKVAKRCYNKSVPREREQNKKERGTLK
jgi:hypothetical protein